MVFSSSLRPATTMPESDIKYCRKATKSPVVHTKYLHESTEDQSPFHMTYRAAYIALEDSVARERPSTRGRTGGWRRRRAGFECIDLHPVEAPTDLFLVARALEVAVVVVHSPVLVIVVGGPAPALRILIVLFVVDVVVVVAMPQYYRRPRPQGWEWCARCAKL